MFTEPRQLIGETIDKLETVSAYFADEIQEQVGTAGQLPVQALAAKEALQTIKVLIPKLRTAQAPWTTQARSCNSESVCTASNGLCRRSTRRRREH